MLPPGGTLSAGQPANIVVQPLVNGLTPGVYQNGDVVVSDGSMRTVTVTAVAPGAQRPLLPRPRCTAPSVLKVVFTELSTGSRFRWGSRARLR